MTTPQIPAETPEPRQPEGAGAPDPHPAPEDAPPSAAQAPQAEAPEAEAPQVDAPGAPVEAVAEAPGVTGPQAGGPQPAGPQGPGGAAVAGVAPYPAWGPGPYQAPGPYPAPGPNQAPGLYPAPGPYPGPGPQAGGAWGPPPGYTWAAPGFAAQPVGNRTNGQAIAAFVLGLLAIVPVSLVFGIIALVRIGRTRQRGKGLAIAGLVLSGVWTVVAAGALVLGVVYVSAHPGGVGPDGTRTVSSLSPGTCFDTTGQSVTNYVTVVDCDTPHDRELYAKIDLSGRYPGLAGDQQDTWTACLQAMGTDFVDPTGLEGEAEPYLYYPEQPAWANGTPQAWCTLTGRSGQQLTGSMMQSPGAYTAIEQSYLKDTVQTTVLRIQIRTTVPSQWKQQLPVAAQLAQADRAEARRLDADAGTDAFGDATAQNAALAIAKEDLVEAGRAQALSQVGSQAQWLAQAGALQPAALDSAILAMRGELDLGGAG